MTKKYMNAKVHGKLLTLQNRRNVQSNPRGRMAGRATLDCVLSSLFVNGLSPFLSLSLSLSPSPSLPPVLNVMEKEFVQKEEQDSKMAIEASLADLSGAAVCIIWCCIFACVVPNSQLAEGRRHKYMYTYIYMYMYDIYIYIPHHHYHPGQKTGIGRTGQFV